MLLLVLSTTAAAAEPPLEEVRKMLPARVGDFTSQRARPLSALGKEIGLENYVEPGSSAMAAATYLSAASGGRLLVEVVRAGTDSAAYAILTGVGLRMRANAPEETKKLDGVGTAGVVAPGRVAFFRGKTFVRITNLETPEASGTDEAVSLARLLAETLDPGDGDIPVLVKHLPDWERAQERASYATRLPTLQAAMSGQPVLESVNFEGGTQAVTADYGSSRLVLVEYTTPQLATDADARITARIKELSDRGEAVPSGYRRVGNYAVFVFNAPDEGTAKQLIDSVSYEQVVQWLGDNPRALERAQRAYTETTANIILAVIKASGLAVLLCLGVGGIFGTLIFRHRRAQQATTAAYSDAGDMIRLNIDDLTPQSSPARLLGRGDG